MTVSSDVLEKIRKLLRLAARAGSEAEATLAAERAQDLLLRHKLDQATILADPTATDRAEPAEPIEELRMDGPTLNVSWRGVLVMACAKAMFCYALHGRGNYSLIGARSDARLAAELYEFLVEQLERAARTYLAGFYKPPRSVGNDFRLACAQRIARRMREQRKAAVAEPAMSQALVVIQRSEQAVAARVKELYPHSRSSKVPTTYGEHAEAGRRAGDAIRLTVQRKLA